MPDNIQPMLATTGELPDDVARWALELKWDGVRAIVYVADGRVRAVGRRGIEATGRYPELQALADLLPDQTAVIDGEVVAFDSEGRPSFERLQARMHMDHPDARLIRQVPVHFVAFDLPYLGGHALYDLPYRERRALLDGLELAAGPIEAPPYLDGAEIEQVRELQDYTREQGLEGLIAKRLDSPYRPGRRVDFWRKVKNFAAQDVVIGGWKAGRGRREGGVGSLLLGVYDGPDLRFVGHVGTGFTDADLDDLHKRLVSLERPDSPYTGEVPREHARFAYWVEPSLTGEVEFSRWTRDGMLLHASWRGLRPEIPPREVHREP
ncbi:bifunctional non-homologous end joining protein LigD [Actinoallomurus bryophytorum]|uniref:DNA ligase (ATP) n=1 Tax=Actinoallomurus bryophytorum TaxID=1490222 RepID=A0A543CEX7_9ACTN|nr:non-homologous end-joining DNA ligase [Actinoallomurus bryophytorum]TQL95639.1 bifunctional non-homologous end joining protein LigD [Actinoallomurus bryophytorum]